MDNMQSILDVNFMQIKHYDTANHENDTLVETKLKQSEPFFDLVKEVNYNGLKHYGHLFIGDNKNTGIGRLLPINYPTDHDRLVNINKSLQNQTSDITALSQKINEFAKFLENKSVTYKFGTYTGKSYASYTNTENSVPVNCGSSYISGRLVKFKNFEPDFVIVYSSYEVSTPSPDGSTHGDSAIFFRNDNFDKDFESAYSLYSSVDGYLWPDFPDALTYNKIDCYDFFTKRITKEGLNIGWGWNSYQVYESGAQDSRAHLWLDTKGTEYFYIAGKINGQ